MTKSDWQFYIVGVVVGFVLCLIFGYSTGNGGLL